MQTLTQVCLRLPSASSSGCRLISVVLLRSLLHIFFFFFPYNLLSSSDIMLVWRCRMFSFCAFVRMWISFCGASPFFTAHFLLFTDNLLKLFGRHAGAEMSLMFPSAPSSVDKLVHVVVQSSFVDLLLFLYFPSWVFIALDFPVSHFYTAYFTFLLFFLFLSFRYSLPLKQEYKENGTRIN